MERGSLSWPSSGVKVTGKHISYYVEHKKGRKAILRDVTLGYEPGELAYLMGPSGAGKSTILDVLAGRVKTGILSGEVLFNGAVRGATFWRESAYVKQDDLHIAVLTVRETLRFAAKLRMGEEYSQPERESRVHSVAELLGLDVCMDTMVGDAATRGISGGQMKRLSIAVEVVSMPSLLFLDEPTSGLDSVIAHEVMTFVHKIASQNRTVICTIHQPSPDTYALSSKVSLLSAGRLCYDGPPGEAAAYFESPELGFVGESFENPADFAIAVVGGALGSVTPRELAERWRAWAGLHPHPLKAPAPSGAASSQRVLDAHPGFPTSLATQSRVLLQRSWVSLSRQRAFLRGQLGKNLAVALVCGLIFVGQGRLPSPTAPGASQFTSTSFNVSSLLFFAMVYTIIGNMQAIPQLFAMRVLYVRERSASLYSTAAYWLAGALVNLPLVCLCHALFLNVAYWIIQLPAIADVFAHTLVVTLLNNLVAFYFAQFLAAAAPSEQVALAVFPVTFLFLTSFAGFTVPLTDLPRGWAWASYVSYARWCYQGLVAMQFSVRPDGAATLRQYGFEAWEGRGRAWLSAPILLLYVVLMNGLVYWGLQLPRSKVRYEPATVEAEEQQAHEERLGEQHVSLTASSGAEGLKQKLLAADDEDLRLSTLILGTLTGGLPQPPPSRERPLPKPKLNSRPSMDVKDFEVRSRGVQKGRGVRVLFRGLEYRARAAKDKEITIISGVSGRVGPGEMCALMGGSGAGKSTLLDVLAGRKTSGCIAGELYYNGRAEAPPHGRCSYVMQDNVHIASFTVRETLLFAALLRIREGEGGGLEEALQRVEDVMRMLGLEEVGDVLVGSALVKGISGGQARRLTIGVEIINLPDLIFLDEPTTGLDSNISYEVMAAVRNLANQNRTIICTIHQPSVEVFALFDKLILMAAGLQVYYGSTHEAVKYFCSPALDFAFSRGTNPAEFVMGASGGVARTRGGLRRDAHELAELYAASELFRAFSEGVQAEPHGGEGEARGRGEERLYPRDMLQITKVLNMRNALKIRKNRRPVVVGVVRHVLVALFYGSLYWRMDPEAVLSRMSLLFFTIMFIMVGNQQSIPAVYEDRLLYYREKGASVYGPYSYWMTCATSYLPQIFVNTLTYSAILYSMTGLHGTAACFGYFWLIILLCSVCALSFCQLLSMALPNSQTTVAIFPATLFMFIAFAGFVVRLPSLPVWLGSWCPNVSFARWAFQGLLINEFEGNPGVNFAGQPTVYYTPEPYSAFMASLGFEGYRKWYSVPILLLNIVVFRALTYVALVSITFEKR